MKLSQLLRSEIESYNSAEPNALIFIDQSSIFWVSNDGHYIWLQDHRGINDYIDADHQIEILRPTAQSTEGVGSEGVYWMNEEFSSPFHISDFTQRIETINVNA